MTGIVSSGVLAQTPGSSRSNATSSNNSTAVTKGSSNATSQQIRQMRKGDSQLTKANNSYQKAQQTISKQNTNNSAANANSASRPSTRPATNSSTTRPAANSTATRPVQPSVSTGNKTTTTTTTRPAANTTTTRPVQPSVSTGNKTTTTTTTRPAANTTTTRQTIESNNANRIVGNKTNVAARDSEGAERISTGQVEEVRRGYTEQGQARPQPVATGPRNEGVGNLADKNSGSHGHGHAAPHTPYVHPNHHNYNQHMHVPPRIRPVYYHGVPYYFYNSVYCRYINGYYVICRPPLGAVIAYAIFNTWRPVIVVHKNVNYYYDDGTFYLPFNNNYQVVAPPIGARVAELPSNYEEIILDNTFYYKVDNVYYKAVVVSGYIWYEVVFVS